LGQGTLHKELNKFQPSDCFVPAIVGLKRLGLGYLDEWSPLLDQLRREATKVPDQLSPLSPLAVPSTGLGWSLPEQRAHSHHCQLKDKLEWMSI